MKSRLKRLISGAAAIAAAVMLVPHANADGGTLRYATIGEPPALDVQMTTATIAITIGEHIFETLYAFDAAYNPQPLLASGETIEDDGKTLVITLRQDVMFHNGKQMTSEDVVASLKRWGEFGSRGQLLMANATSLEATGQYEITLKLSEPNGAWKSMLAYPEGGPVIYPAEIVGKAGNQPIEQVDYIGTGPYKFKEWRPNRHIELERFDGYKPRDEASDGYAGARKAGFDILRFIPVPDVGTRVSGVQAGDYDYAEFISGDLYESLSNDDSVRVHRSGAPLFGTFFMNSKAGMFKDNYALRRAVQTALEKTAALRVSFGPEGLWNAQGSIFAEGNRWYSTAGIDAYNPHDAAEAKEMAIAAGYDGTPIRLLVSTNYQTHYDQATVFTRQLAEAGINVQMIVVDWATLLKMRGEPEQWDMFVTHHSFVPDPILFTPLNDTYPGWWSSPEKEALKKEFVGTADPDARKAAWDKIQALFYEQVPAIKVGDAYSYDIASPRLNGMGEHTVLWPHFWNVSFK